MKTLPVLFSLAAFALSSPSAAAAEVAAGSTADTKVAAVLFDADSPDVAEIRAMGERAINRVGVSLVSEVTSAVAKDGAEGAVGVCHLKALPLTGEIIAGMPRITAVKRTSLRLRNPANAPDAAEQLVLDRVQRDISRGDVPPKLLVQRIDLEGDNREWRVYRPIGVLPQCVACHGAVEKQSAALREALQKLYPGDQATGYAAGEWRGLIRVTVMEPKPVATPAPATKKLPARKA
ncbi:MAG: DUF3365 domain-containing protein [Opitutaceae bacterium]|nr:DUF3365 domain-containing protein [Opitutaceae bacterium]